MSKSKGNICVVDGNHVNDWFAPPPKSRWATVKVSRGTTLGGLFDAVGSDEITISRDGKYMIITIHTEGIRLNPRS